MSFLNLSGLQYFYSKYIKPISAQIKSLSQNITNLSSQKANISDIANNLTTTVAGKMLDARMGKSLSDLLASHKSSADHDSRYYTETEINSKLKPLQMIGLSAVFRNNAEYNIDSSASSQKGTAWNEAIFNGLGVTYIPDTSTYLNKFKVPYKGKYLILVDMTFLGTSFNGEHALYGYLYRNNVQQSQQIQPATNYRTCHYIFLNHLEANDQIYFSVLQNSGSVVKVATASRMNIIYLGNY